MPVELGKRAGLDSGVVIRAQREQCIRRLITLLTVPEPEDRQTAICALGRIGPEAQAAVPALMTALQDPDPDVRVLLPVPWGRLVNRNKLRKNHEVLHS